MTKAKARSGKEVHSDIRYYKGKHKVRVLQKSRMNWLVEVLEAIPYKVNVDSRKTIGTRFTTVPRLLHRKKREALKGAGEQPK